MKNTPPNYREFYRFSKAVDRLDLGATHKQILKTLATFDLDGDCFPAKPRLVRAVGTPKRTLDRGLAYLSELGLIEIQRRMKGRGWNDSNRYVLDYDRIMRVVPERHQGVVPGWPSKGSKYLNTFREEVKEEEKRSKLKKSSNSKGSAIDNLPKKKSLYSKKRNARAFSSSEADRRTKAELERTIDDLRKIDGEV